MNRADQAPEPSIEELLASIRLIISDADKQAPVTRDPRALAAHAGEALSPGALGELSADDVFDLTDELSPVGEAARPQSAPQPVTRLQPSFGGHPGVQPYVPPRRAAGLPAPEVAQAAPHARPAARESAVPAHAVRPEARKPAQPPVSSPAWTRRDAPAAAPQPAAAPAKPRQEQMAPRQPAKNWAGDIQIPVPDQGPVSLFPAPADGKQESQTAGKASAAAAQVGADVKPAPAQGDAEGPADMAVLAQRLARSAIGVLEASELENATQVDFAHLDAASKAEVAEKFADAIESAAHTAAEAAERQAAQQVRPIVSSAESTAPAPRGAKEEPAPKAGTPAKAEVKPEAQAKPEPKEAPAKPAQPSDARPAGSANVEAPVRAEAPAIGTPVKPAAAPAPIAAAPAPLAVQSLAQVQFVGPAAPPVSSQGGGALESVVREMLRPLLVQWLNENMPRILENAIREEIAMRGLLPKSDG